MSQGVSAKKSGHTYPQWIFALLANSTMLVYGLESGWISPITALFQSEASPVGYPMTNGELSWIASALSMTATLGVITYSYIADRYGRKIGVIIIAFLEGISWMIRLFKSSATLLIVARVFAGLAAGGCFNIIPMYVKEISQENLTGILGTFPTVMYTTGIFLMYVIGAYLNYTTVIIIVMIIPIMTILSMIKAPESPAFLVKQDKIDKALETVAYLRGLDKDDVVVRKIVDNMIDEEIRFKSLPKITFINILKNKCWRRSFIIIMCAFTFFELNGAFVIITFASKMLASTGIQFDVSPEVQSLSFPFVMIIASLGLTTFVERCARKPLLIIAYSLTMLAMFSLAIIIIVQINYGNVPAWMPLTALVVSVAACSGGTAPITYITLTEMFEFQIRAKMMGAVVTYAWFLTFLSQVTYTTIANAFGESAPYILYGCVNVGAVFFVIFFLTETKGKTEEEILNNVKNNENSITA